MSDIKKEIPLSKTIGYKTPGTPNFIIASDHSRTDPIQYFTDEELQIIGEVWTDNLIKKAQEKRRKQL